MEVTETLARMRKRIGAADVDASVELELIEFLELSDQDQRQFLFLAIQQMMGYILAINQRLSSTNGQS